MLTALSAVTSVVILAQVTGPTEEERVRQAVQSFYDAFNGHDFARAVDFAAADWTHINPLGGCTRGREAVLRELKDVHSTFLKGVSDTPNEMSIRFATPDVAIATVSSRVSTYMTPDGTRHENEQQIRTFVMVKRQERWRILQDQNTIRAR